MSIATTNRFIAIELAMQASALAACEMTPMNPGSEAIERSPDILAWLESR